MIAYGTVRAASDNSVDPLQINILNCSDQFGYCCTAVYGKMAV